MAVTIKDLRFSIYLNNADAKKSAIEFEKQLQLVGAEMANLSNQGKKDTPLYREKKKAFDDLKASMEANKIQSGLLAMSWNELNKLQKTMSADKNRMIPDSAEWKKLDADIKVVQARMSELKGNSSDTQNSLNKMAGGFSGFINAAKSGDIVGMIPMLGKYAAVIGLVTGALGFAKSAMESTRATSKEFKADMEGISTAWTYFLKSVASGDFSFTKMIEAFNAGHEYKLTLGSIAKEQQALDVEAAKNFNRVQALLEIQRDVTKTIQERKNAGSEILKITQSEGNIKQDVATKSYNNAMNKMTALTGLSKSDYESFMEGYNKKEYHAFDKSAEMYNKLKSTIKDFTYAPLEMVKNTPFEQVYTAYYNHFVQELKKSKKELTGDDLIKVREKSVESMFSNDVKVIARTQKAYGKTTKDEIDNLVQLQVAAIRVPGEVIQETMRVRRTNHKLEKDLTDEEIKKHQEAAKAAQKILDDQKDKRDKINADGNIQMEVETAAYNKRLKDKGLFEKESTNLTAEQLKERERLEDEYYANLSKIAVENENKRFSTTKKDAGVDGDPNKFKGEKLKAYELLVQQHEINLTNISDSENKKRLDARKLTDAAILSILGTAQESELLSINTVIEAKTHSLKNDYLNHANGIVSEEIYQKALSQLSVDSLNDRLAAEIKYRDLLKAMNLPKTKENVKALKDSEKAVASTQAQIDDIQLKDVEKFEKDKNKIKSKYSINSLAEQYRIEKAAIDAKYLHEKNAENAHQKELFQLKVKYAVKYAQEAEQVANSAGNFISALDQAQTDNLEAEKQKQLTIAGNNADARAKVESEFAKKELDLKKKQADADMAIKVAQALAAGALGIANIWAVDGINPILAGILTAIEVATVGMQISSIIAQRNAIKNTSLGYYDGGPTAYSTDDKTVVGEVHANEHVVTAKGVRNPAVKKFLDVFHAAELNGSIQMLNTPQILEKVRVGSSSASRSSSGGYAESKNGSVGTFRSEVSMAIISENARQMERLNDHLDNGILAHSVVSGDYGSVKQTERFLKMRSNVTRHG